MSFPRTRKAWRQRCSPTGTWTYGNTTWRVARPLISLSIRPPRSLPYGLRMGGASDSTPTGREDTDLYLRAATGAGSEELLYADEQDKNPTSWSRDGKFILYHTTATQLVHLFALPMIPEQPGIAQARAGPPSQVQHLVGAVFPGWEMGGIYLERVSTSRGLCGAVLAAG